MRLASRCRIRLSTMDGEKYDEEEELTGEIIYNALIIEDTMAVQIINKIFVPIRKDYTSPPTLNHQNAHFFSQFFSISITCAAMTCTFQLSRECGINLTLFLLLLGRRFSITSYYVPRCSRSWTCTKIYTYVILIYIREFLKKN